MTTKKNLVKQVLMSILTAGIFSFSFAFTACDDEDILSNEAPSGPDDKSKTEQVIGDGDITVEAFAACIPYQVKASGAWHIEQDRRFFTVEPESGNGDTEVTIYMQNNNRNNRKAGHLIIVNDMLSKADTLLLVQKTKSECLTRGAGGEVIPTTSNEKYAVGYSYDCTDLYADPSSIRLEVFDTNKLIQLNKLSLTSLNGSFFQETYTGSSISEITNDLSVKADVKGGFGKFTAEANASFDMKNARNDKHEYALTYMNYQLTESKLGYTISNLRSKYMTEEAYEDINGINEDYTGAEGLKQLVEDYGTHVIMKAQLGGRIRSTIDIDVTKVTGSYDIKAFAKASYDGVKVDGSVEAKEEFKKSYEENQSAVTKKTFALGGTKETIDALCADITNENIEAWKKSIEGKDMALMGFDDKSLRPLYELVDKKKFPERYEELKQYMEGGGTYSIAKDFGTYDCGTVVQIDVPSFNGNGTLVKDIYLDGQKVGMACSEYIPLINQKERITVIYPVINCKPRFNMGFFIGNASQKPKRISWESDGTVTVEDYDELDFGQAKKLYLRGASVSSEVAEGLAVKLGNSENAYMEATKNVTGGEKPYNYPVVKIFNQIWTREYYGGLVTNVDDCKWQAFYYSPNALKKFTLRNYRPASVSDYEHLHDMLVASGSTQPTKLLDKGGVTGFDIDWKNWVENGQSVKSSDRAEYMAPYKDGTFGHVCFRKNGSMEILKEFSNNWRMPVRMVYEPGYVGASSNNGVIEKPAVKFSIIQATCGNKDMPASNLFDGKLDTEWSIGTVHDEVIGTTEALSCHFIEFKSSEPIVLKGYTLTSYFTKSDEKDYRNGFGHWTLYAKRNKNDEYKPVAKGDEILNGTKKFNIEVPAEYQYFVLGRITGNYNVTKSQNDGLRIAELQLDYTY